MADRRVPLSGTLSDEVIGGGRRYQRSQEQVELLDLADGDDAEHDHGQQAESPGTPAGRPAGTRCSGASCLPAISDPARDVVANLQSARFCSGNSRLCRSSKGRIEAPAPVDASIKVCGHSLVSPRSAVLGHHRPMPHRTARRSGIRRFKSYLRLESDRAEYPNKEVRLDFKPWVTT